MTIQDCLDETGRLVERLTPYIIEFEKTYGGGTVHSKFVGIPCNTLFKIKFNLFAINDTFANGDWWRKFGSPTPVPEEIIIKHLENQYQHFRFSYFLSIYSIIEANIRSVCRAIDATYFENATANNFVGIRQVVFKQLGLGDKYDNLFKFCHTIRNSVHNNGHHTKKACVMSFNGIDYHFQYMTGIDFFTISLFYEVLKALVECIADVADQPRFRGLK